MKRILYDGWDLVYRPEHPAALHLLALLACHPAGYQAVAALPSSSSHPLPEGVESQVEPTEAGEAGCLHWEQRRLPGMARKLGIDLLHTFGDATLFSPCPTVISPCEYGWGEARSLRSGRPLPLAGRLREAMGAGGAARSDGILWPEDLPEPEGVKDLKGLGLFRLSPVVHPAFLEPRAEYMEEESGAPEGCVLFHGPGHPADLQRLLNAWSWAAGPVGEVNPLLAVGLAPPEREWLKALADEFEPGGTVLQAERLSLPGLVATYQKCSAMIHLGEIAPWGDPLRMAMACGKPVIGVESPSSDALLGPAAYLTPGDGAEEAISRGLGAALITVLVEEGVAQSLSQKARQRAAAYDPQLFSIALAEVYAALIG